MIEEDYRSHFLVDNLPVAMTVFHENDDGTTIKAYEVGYPIGHVVGRPDDDDNDLKVQVEEKPKDSHYGKQRIVLFNHLRFTILMHEDMKKGTRRVVGFEVEPFSVHHTYMNQIDFSECVGVQAGDHKKCNLDTCSARKPVGLHERPLMLDVNKRGKTEVIWTYDVIFQTSNIKWSTRWDTYLQSADDAEVCVCVCVCLYCLYLYVRARVRAHTHTHTHTRAGPDSCMQAALNACSTSMHVC